MSNRHLINMPHRQGVPMRVMDQISTSKCYHVDAWLIQADDDELYLIVEGRRGGVELLHARVVYHASEQYGLRQVEYNAEGIPRYIGGKWSKREAPWLNALHWNTIYPLLCDTKAQHLRTSVKLHYVWTNKAIDNPCDELSNTYYDSERGARDAARMSPERRHSEDNASRMSFGPVQVQPKFTARERSVLRTLDKLLK